MQTDPIADLLTRIRNASRAKHARVDVPSSKMKNELARILKEEGYISTYKLIEENKVRTFRVPARAVMSARWKSVPWWAGWASAS